MGHKDLPEFSMRPEKQEAEAGPQRSAPLGNHTKPPISVWRFGGLDMPEYEYACSGVAEKPNTPWEWSL